MLKRGSKIRCIDDLIDVDAILEISSNFPNWVQAGKDYTVRDLYLFTDEFETVHTASVTLEEIRNPLIEVKGFSYKVEPAFNIVRFALHNETITTNLCAN